jgi:ribonucleoside-diphosphate reductase alpha chain
MMRVQKRNGQLEDVSFDKVLKRIQTLSNDLKNINPFEIAQNVCMRIYDGVKTRELDELTAQLCSSSIVKHLDYGTLAARIAISNHHKNTSPSFSEVVAQLYGNYDKAGEHCPLVSRDLYTNVMANKEKYNACIDYTRDYLYDYFGWKTLEKSYLLRKSDAILERPQHMWLRVAIGIHKDDVKDALRTYELMSTKHFTHASPTLFNAGTPRPQCSSCFLYAMKDDSISGIFESLADIAQISKYSGGIGMHIHNIRCQGSRIRGTNGVSTGIIPMLRIFNNTARYVNQCFVPETEIVSINGIKPMQMVSTNDRLLTRDGTFRQVHNVARKHVHNQDMLQFTTEYSLGAVTATPEHEFFVMSEINHDPDQDGTYGTYIPQYVFAQDVKVSDFMGYPIPNYELDVSGFDDIFCEFYGMMIVHGRLDLSGGTDPPKTDDHNQLYPCILDLPKDNMGLNKLKFLAQFSEQYDMTNMKLPYSLLYDAKGDKCIHPYFLHLPLAKLRRVLKGIMDSTDEDTGARRLGVVNEPTPLDGLNALDDIIGEYFGSMSSTLTFHTTNKALAEAVRYMCIRMKILPKCSYEAMKKTYTLHASKSNQRACLMYQGMLWAPIHAINNTKYTGQVLDFNMVDNHNYTIANLGLVHNSGKRNGSIAVYLEPWHGDIERFLDLRKNHGHEEDRCRDLFLALWIPDLFMQRVQSNGLWSLMCPDQCRDLSDLYGDAFETRYISYEQEGKYIKQMPAQELWFQILESQIETGTPYLLFKDACNQKSNQKHLGTIKSSNLCVSGDTMILTKSMGYCEIGNLIDTPIQVWNGKAWSWTMPMKTGTHQPMVEVTCSNGMRLTCTPYHKFYVENAPSHIAHKGHVDIVECEAQALSPNMKLMPFELLPVDDNGIVMAHAYTQGLYASARCGDWVEDEHFDPSNDPSKEMHLCRCLYLYGKRQRLISSVEFARYHKESVQNRYNIQLPSTIKPHDFVPMDYCTSTKLRWLEGLVDGDGMVMRSNNKVGEWKSYHIRIISAGTDHKFHMRVVYLLQTLGIQPWITQGRRGSKLFIDAWDVVKMVSMGFNPKFLNLTKLISKTIIPTTHYDHHSSKPPRPYVRVTSVTTKDIPEDTYCFNEPLEHKGMFNGILTGNCSEIVQYSSPEETAVCNLSSIGLPMYLDKDKKTFDFQKLHDVTKVVTRNLNKVIDLNFYPIETARVSNLKHRPIGIGIQGLADVFALMRLPYDSDEARTLNRDIFETIYHAALEASMEIARKRTEIIRNECVFDGNGGHDNDHEDSRRSTLQDKLRGIAYLQWNEYEADPMTTRIPGAYSTFDGSPASRGELQFDLWEIHPGSSRYDWDDLKIAIRQFGLRNSLLIAPMPTASTAQILGNNESFEPFTSNVFKRKTLSGEFIMINKYLMKDLMDRGIWNENVKDQLIFHDGSVQNIEEVPEDLKRLYKTVWEIKQKALVDMCVDRGPFVDQSQSMNLFVEDPDFKKLSSMHFYSWKRGLKCGIYYLRTRPKSNTQKFTLDPSLEAKWTHQQQSNQAVVQQQDLQYAQSNKNKPKKVMMECTDEVCTMCSG